MNVTVYAPACVASSENDAPLRTICASELTSISVRSSPLMPFVCTAPLYVASSPVSEGAATVTGEMVNCTGTDCPPA